MSPTTAIRLVTWTNAWLTGHVALDDLVDGVRGDDVAHTFAFPDTLPQRPPATGSSATGSSGVGSSGVGSSGVGASGTGSMLHRPGGWPDLSDADTDGRAGRQPRAAVAEALPIPLAMGELRRRGATGLHLALPVAGDPLGIAGPPSTTALVVDAGQAAVVGGAGIALVPEVVGRGVQWTAVPASPPTAVASPAEAERAMSEELLAAARELAALDVARWNPGLPGLLADADPGRRAAELPSTLGVRRTGLIARATRLRLALSLALAEDGGARTLAESRRRRELLEPLERAVRRAVVAACAPDAAPA